MAEYVNGVDVNGSGGGGVDVTAVHLAGTETVTGDKTFTGVTNLNGQRKIKRTRVTGDYTVLASDYVIEADATSNKLLVTLPDATASTGREIPVVNVAGANRVRVTAAAGLVGGLTTFAFLYALQYLSFVSDGTNWNIMNASGLLLDPASRSDVTIKTRFRADASLVTLVSSAVSDLAPLNFATGYGDHAVQATGANRPTITTAWSGGEDAIAFNGTSNYLATAAWSGGAIAQPITLYMALDINTTAQRIPFDGITSGNRISMDNNSTTLSMFAGGSVAASALGFSQTLVNNKRVVAAQFNNTSSGIYINGAKVASGTAGTGTPTGLTFGARYSVDGFFWSGNIGEWIVCAGAHSDWLVTRNSRFLMDYWQLGT